MAHPHAPPTLASQEFSARIPLLLGSMIVGLVFVACDGATPASDAGSLDTSIDVAPPLARRPNTSCVAPPKPQSGQKSLARRFTGLPRLAAPVDLLRAPGEPDHFYVVEKFGTVRRFSASGDGSDVTLALDIGARVEAGPNEAGLLSIAFHPNYRANNRVFLSYTFARDGALFSRISEIRGDRGVLSAAEERVIREVEQPYGNHNGGHIVFGPEGYLYIALGDGGSGGDPLGHGQNANSLLGTILRIDVNGATPYEVPADNPFVGKAGANEIYAWGLRNPWKLHWDLDTQRLWTADVGQNAYEEIDLIERGGNYGWNPKEGFECFGAGPCEGDFVDPVLAYPHAMGRSITGGVVYRGAELPDLFGNYLYADYVSGRFWALKESGGAFSGEELFVDGQRAIAAFASDANGEVFVTDVVEGSIYQLVSPSAELVSLPQTLAETGCFDAAGNLLDGAQTYEVRAPLFSDGASKTRALALVEGTTIEGLANGDIEAPPGSVFIKTFVANGAKVETRFFVRYDDGSYGAYSYAWNAAGTEATLVPVEGQSVVHDGSSVWDVPSRSQCFECHTAASGRVLGFEAMQLGDSYAAFIAAGYVDGDDVPFPAFGTADNNDDENWVRSYLHSNCSACHQPGGTGRGELDLRFTTSLADSGLLDSAQDGLGVKGAKVIASGDKDASVLYQRMTSPDDALRMPAVGTSIVDDSAVSRLASWIDALP